MTRLQIIGGEALVGGVLAAKWADATDVRIVEAVEGRRAELRATFPGVEVTDSPAPSDGTIVATKPAGIAAATTAATAAGLPVVSPTVTTSALTGKDDLFLRVTEDTRGYSDLAANHHFRKTGLRRVAIVFDTRNRAYTEDWVQGFRLSFTGLGGKVVAEVPFESGDMPNHPALVRELLAGKPDGLVFVSSAIDAARFAQAARDAGARQTLIGVEWAATERFIELGGKAVDGVYLTQFFDRQSAAPEFQSMRQAYEARFKAPPASPRSAPTTQPAPCCRHWLRRAAERSSRPCWRKAPSRVPSSRFSSTASATPGGRSSSQSSATDNSSSNRRRTR